MPLRLLIAAFLLCAATLPGHATELDAPPGALSCSGCHPAGAGVQTPVTRIVGRNADDIVTALLEFKSGKVPATVMDRVAKGFTDDEIRAIASWYAARRN